MDYQSCKPCFIYGHFFEAVGVLIGSAAKSFCLPLSMQVHDEDKTISKWLKNQSVSRSELLHIIIRAKKKCTTMTDDEIDEI